MKTANLVELLRLVTFLPLIIVLIALITGFQSSSDANTVYASTETPEAIHSTD